MNSLIKTIIGLLLGVFPFSYLGAQSVAIGSNIPNASAILDVQSTTKGILLPRLSFSQLLGINNPENGLLVFNASTNGFYYNMGTKAEPSWERIAEDKDLVLVDLWLLSGNSNINPSIHALGNADATDIKFRVNNSRVGVISASNQSLFLGHLAGNEFATGIANVAIGNAALQANTNGGGLVAIGQNALNAYNSTNGFNVAIGKDALRYCNTCDHSVAIGIEALKNSNGSALGNVAIGYGALYGVSTNMRNTAIGKFALYNFNSGNNNVAVGADAGKTGADFTNVTLFGASSSATSGITDKYCYWL